MEHPAKFVDLKVGRSAYPSGIVRTRCLLLTTSFAFD